MNEIGSEFWPDGVKQEKQNSRADKGRTGWAYLLSGRTALDYIIRDIKKTRRFSAVMLPSFCCESMIAPFLHNGIKVCFYRVCDRGIFYPDNRCDVVLLMDYFGYRDKRTIEIAEYEKQNGKTVIYDATHRISWKSSEISWADYIFCSYRKWLYCNFAEAVKLSGDFIIPAPAAQNDNYLYLRDTAAKIKAVYIEKNKKELFGKDADKKEFLELFSRAEGELDRDYAGYAGDPIYIDTDEIAALRRKNAFRLFEGLRDVCGVSFFRRMESVDDTPLFVPILVPENKRDQLKRYLVSKSVYCPAHWPLTKLHQGIGRECKKIYRKELSLICDQRYSADDMDREIEIIKEFFGGGKDYAVRSVYN